MKGLSVMLGAWDRNGGKLRGPNALTPKTTKTPPVTLHFDKVKEIEKETVITPRQYQV